MHDLEGRKVDYLRISITDHCNLKCVYCIPKGHTPTYCKKGDLLTIDEILKIVRAAATIGITKIKLTGGEPLVREDLVDMIKRIKNVTGIEQVTLTTNGILLKRYGKDLVEAGIDGINISLDTLDQVQYANITQYDGLLQVLEGIHVVKQAGLQAIKLNVVPIKNMNEKDLLPLIELANKENLTIRFIELMPIGYGKAFVGISKQAIIEQLEQTYGRLTPYKKTLGNGPAEYYSIEGLHGKIGFINAVSQHFCSTCNRVRITCEGYLKLCLHYNKGIALKPYLEEDEQVLIKVLKNVIQYKPKQHNFDAKMVQELAIEQRMMSQIGG